MVTGGPRALLRAEGVALLVASILLFARLPIAGWLYPVLLLAPDASMAGYALGPRAGATLYDLGHTTTLAGALSLAGWAAHAPLATALGLIWLGHIGFDRALGYGLKYSDGFASTHLGRIGRPARGAR
jgi:uncharacterized protein DUF4260